MKNKICDYLEKGAWLIELEEDLNLLLPAHEGVFRIKDSSISFWNSEGDCVLFNENLNEFYDWSVLEFYNYVIE